MKYVTEYGQTILEVSKEEALVLSKVVDQLSEFTLELEEMSLGKTSGIVFIKEDFQIRCK